jgi:hypothetical protein
MSYPTVSRFYRPAVLLVVLLASSAALHAQLTATQIIEHMAQANVERRAHMAHSRSLRHYHVEYNGVTHLSADMDVDAEEDARTGKSLRIVAQTGSKMLCEKVLRHAVESEQEAAADHNNSSLTTTNYHFTLAGMEAVNGRAAYVLAVEPIRATRFLYRGRIWIDAAEFALVRIDASPARSPSFWIARTLIEQSFAQVGEQWVPARNRSETHVRVGGTALLTIDFGHYSVEQKTTLVSYTASQSM